MAFCPVCKCEYKKGIEKCAECKVSLVETLKENSYQDLSETFVDEDIKKIVPKEVFENKNLHFLDRESEMAVVKAMKKPGVYRKSKEIVQENQASAYMLLVIGILGIVVLALIGFDIIHIPYSISAKIISGSVMGTLFIVFIVMGIQSMKTAKKYSVKAKEEDDLTANVLDYCKKNLSSEVIDKECEDEEWDTMPDEMKYFKRAEYIKNFMSQQFDDLDEEFAGYLADEIYAAFYDDEEV